MSPQFRRRSQDLGDLRNRCIQGERLFDSLACGLAE